MFRRFAGAVTGAALILSVAASTVAAGGPPSLAFYVDDVRYRTVGTPTDFFDTGVPASNFNPIYALGNGLASVGTYAPGDAGYKGGRWAVYPVTWHVTPVQFTDAAEVLAAAQAGDITIASAPIKEFLCTVNKVPASWNK